MTDVVIVGAGFSGMYLWKLLREAGLSSVILEAGHGVGGTWYWNRYPGARCDVPSVQYAHSYLPVLEQGWDWTERYAAQPELLTYANEIADRLGLREDIRFGHRVVEAGFGDAGWTVTCDTGATFQARYLVMATGCLSAPNEITLDGQDRFAGAIYHTGRWPQGGVDFSGLRVGVVGTGSSGMQSIPEIARQAKALTVFQRTAHYAVPARNHPLDDAARAAAKADYPALRARQRLSAGAFDAGADPTAFAARMSAEERTAILEARWAEGGLGFGAAFMDTLLDEEVNAFVAEFLRSKIRAAVRDPDVAELLCPKVTVGAKRMCVVTEYFETYNLTHVQLMDISQTPLQLAPNAARVGEVEVPLDALVLATGFDAMTGAVLRVDIKGRDGQRMQDHWSDGPSTYLGLCVSGFPNLFLVTGPQSPSVLTNVTQSIEQHCEWIAACLTEMDQAGLSEIEASAEAETAWVQHCDALAQVGLKAKTKSWYTGQNIAGKPARFMPYLGGFPDYVARCKDVVRDGYRGFLRR